MRDPFARATQSILRRLGKDALLRSAPAGRVHIEHGVEVYERNDQGESVFSRSVATIEKQYAPAQGDTLVLYASSDDTRSGGVMGTYRVERLFADTGYAERRIVLPVS